MSDFQKQVISDLAKKYIFETFDFKNKSPEDLLTSYQQTFEKLQDIVDKQNSKASNENLNAWLNKS